MEPLNISDKEIDFLLDRVLNQDGKFREEIATLRKGFDVATDGWWEWHIQRDYEEYSDKFRSTLGFEKHEFPNSPESWQKQIHPDDLKVALDNYNKHIETMGKHPFHQFVRYNCKDGSIKHFLCRGSVVRWGGRTPILMLGTHTDVTDLVNRDA